MASLLDHPNVSGRYLFPQPRRVGNPWLVPVEGAELACYRRIVDPSHVTLMHFHGNGEAAADYIPWMADEFADLGLNSLFIEYRGYGGSSGKAQIAKMLGDGEAVMIAAGLKPEQVIAFGRSVGSLYAIELVHRRPSIAGLILESGIAEPVERFLKYADLSGPEISRNDVIEAANSQFNHQSKLSEYHQPALILHTVHDSLVDISHAEKNLEWLASRQKKLIRFPYGDHNSILTCNHEKYLAAIDEFVKSLKIG